MKQVLTRQASGVARKPNCSHRSSTQAEFHGNKGRAMQGSNGSSDIHGGAPHCRPPEVIGLLSLSSFLT